MGSKRINPRTAKYKPPHGRTPTPPQPPPTPKMVPTKVTKLREQLDQMRKS